MIALELSPAERLYLLRLVERQQLHLLGKFEAALAVTTTIREFESKDFLAKLVGTLSTASRVPSVTTRGGA